MSVAATAPTTTSDPAAGLGAWLDATAELRRTIHADAAAKAEKAIRKSRGDKAWTRTQDTLVQRRAKAATLRALYLLPEYDGTRNPTHHDPEFGMAAEAAANAELDALAAWLAKQEWSEFAVSLARQYQTKGTLSDRQIASAKSMQAKVEARAAAKATAAKEAAAAKAAAPAPAPAPAATDLDLTDIPAGMYAVPGGDTRLKVRIAKPGRYSKWAGWVFVDDGAEYGQQQRYGAQRPGEATYRGKIEDQLRAIVADPKAAAVAYGKLTGTCAMCGAVLENETSVAAGIGPVCAGKF